MSHAAASIAHAFGAPTQAIREKTSEMADLAASLSTFSVPGTAPDTPVSAPAQDLAQTLVGLSLGSGAVAVQTAVIRAVEDAAQAIDHMVAD